MNKNDVAAVLSVLLVLALASCTNPPGKTTEAAAHTHIEILSPKALDYIDPRAQLITLGAGYAWTEGPLWVEDGGYLLFSDIPNNVIFKYSPGQGVSRYLDKAGATGLLSGDDNGGSNGLLLDNEGQLILLQQGDRRVARMQAPLDTPKAHYHTLTGSYNGSRLNSPNDATLDESGNLYFTDPPYGLAGGFDDSRRELNFSGVFRLTHNGELTLLDDSVKAPNGIALSPDNNTLYVAVSDAEQPIWLAYDLTSRGEAINKRVWFDARNASTADDKGVPDGMAVHSSGAIYATAPGGVWLFSPAGELLAKIHTGRLTANCALNTEEDYLYITAHDTLLGLPLAH
ncbi:SMP-30/gluconolactonase/LRE family protein [Gilvimarinus agarilyticus]|uniref:SMP-30/gluconolactonase/LRE family protein n=1 Tax=Gilvimarinus agarilyticus TaxID=679259 RepID=UPI0005A0A75D|nr:SMP-30/gluconolactonase/LRE family protein [Gilvimarinus agarilyticus]